MIVYAETNFICEIAYRREFEPQCEELLALAEAGRIELAVPTYSLVESLTQFEARGRHRRAALDDTLAKLRAQVQDVSRSREFTGLTDPSNETWEALTSSLDQDGIALQKVLDRLVPVATLIELSTTIVSSARDYLARFGMEKPQDATVLASIIQHLKTGVQGHKIFVTRDAKDFSDPDISDELSKYGCELAFHFAKVLHLVQQDLGKKGP